MADIEILGGFLGLRPLYAPGIFLCIDGKDCEKDALIGKTFPIVEDLTTLEAGASLHNKYLELWSLLVPIRVMTLM